MLEILRDPIWQFMGFLAAIIIAVVGYYVAHREKERRELSPTLVANIPLISLVEEAELKGRLKILFDKKVMATPDIYTLLIRLSNTGNKPIGADDFSSPIRIEFSEKSEVLTANVERTYPTKFDAKAELDPTDKTRALVYPVLLNKEYSLMIKVLVRSNIAAEPTIYAHLKGVTVLPLSYSPRRSYSTLLESTVYVVAFTIVLWAFGILIVQNFLPASFSQTTLLTDILVALILGAIGFVLYMERLARRVFGEPK